MPLSRWNDERLDDVHKLVQSIDARQDNHERALVDMRELVKAHESALSNIGKTGDRRNERAFTIMLMVPTWLIAVVTVVLEVVHAFHG